MAATQTTKRNGKLARGNGRPAVKMAPVTAAASSTPATQCQVIDLTRLPSPTRHDGDVAKIEELGPKLRSYLAAVKRLLASHHYAGGDDTLKTLRDDVVYPAWDLMQETCELFSEYFDAVDVVARYVDCAAEHERKATA